VKNLLSDKSNRFKEFNINPNSKIKSTVYYLKIIPILIGANLKKKLTKFSRTQKVSYEEYNSNWKRIFEEKYWKESKDLKDFCFPKFQNGVDYSKLGKSIVENRFCDVSRYDFFRYYFSSLLELFNKYTNNETVVELGSGYGLQLFILKSLNFKNKLEGYDLTKFGVETAREINDYFDCNIKFGKIDLTKKIDSINLKGKTVFTHFAMEQLKYHTSQVIENIIEAQPKQVLHFEPLYELFKNNLRDVACKLYIKLTDYQDNLLTTLRIFESEGKLKILDVFRLGYEVKPIKEVSFIRWLPKI